MPTQCPLHISKVSQKYLKEFLELLPAQPDSFLKIAQRVVRSYGVHNNAFMDRQMDGWMDGFHADSYISKTAR